MYLYQIWWSCGYEERTGAILTHEKQFTQSEFDMMTDESRINIGGYSTMLTDIEDDLIKNYGFKRAEYLLSQV